MAKPLTVEYQGKLIDLTLEKVDRARLYGYVETEVLDEHGNRCEMATLTADGHSIVGKGGIALAHLTQDGLWRKKAELRPVDVHGKDLTPVRSSFDAPVKLERTATLDEYLSHNIHLIYRLVPDREHPALVAELQRGTIFAFPFSFRGGVEASAGHLLRGSDGNLFLCVGSPAALEFVSLEAITAVADGDDSDDADEEGALDFNMV